MANLGDVYLTLKTDRGWLEHAAMRYAISQAIDALETSGCRWDEDVEIAHVYLTEVLEYVNDGEEETG